LTAIAQTPAAAAPLLARIGFTTRGIVYLLIGGFTVAAALRSGEHAHGLTDAMQAVSHWPFGGVLVMAISLGLLCFAGWLAIEGARRCLAAHNFRTGMMAVGMLGDAALYLGLVVILLGVAIGWHKGGEHELHLWVAWLFGHPFGRWAVGVTGAALIVGGGGLLIWAWTRDVEQKLDMPADDKKATRPISRYGVSGRGVTLALIGFYLIAAAWHARPDEAHDVGAALQNLRHTAYGWVLMLLFALSFGASAFFDFLAALYRRVEVPARFS